MKLIAKVTLVTPGGAIPPGGEIEVKDKAESDALVSRGFAEAPAPRSKPWSPADPAGKDPAQ
jgi:hypothetical protein